MTREGEVIAISLQKKSGNQVFSFELISAARRQIAECFNSQKTTNFSVSKYAAPDLRPRPAGLDHAVPGGGRAARDQHRRRLVALVVHLDAVPEAERGRRNGPRHLRRRQADQGQVLH